MIHVLYLAAAQWSYQELGYTPIDVPWWATRDIVNLTKAPHLPADNEYELSLNKKCLLASGEQGFLYMANKGQLPTGKFQTITPCFRNEPHDSFHQKQFMKLELIDYLGSPALWEPTRSIDDLNDRIEDMVDHALDTFNAVGKSKMALRVVKTSDTDPVRVPGTVSYDIEAQYNGIWIEMGSYGARQAVFGTWIYGTGLAEPRFSKLLHAGQ